MDDTKEIIKSINREGSLKAVNLEKFEAPDPSLGHLEQIQFLINQCFPGQLGLQLEKLEAEEAVGVFEYKKSIAGLHGLVHGGALFSVGDTITGLMMSFYLTEEFSQALTANASIRYLRPVPDGKVRCVCSLKRMDEKDIFLTADFYNEEKKRVAQAKFTYRLISGLE